ncbi:MAG: quinol:cytochrome C oxidoreductase [Ignavibacteria bacterium]|nr:quinol:cytochrome C oxidoreductase [Ignavibacteria bacterium]
MSQIDAHYNKKELPEKLLRMGIILLIIGVVLGLVGFIVDPARASFNYLIAYTFLISIAVGALFLIALEYATGAIWSVPFRRVTEFFAAIIPLLLILVIPLLFNMHNLFHWTHEEVVAGDKILQGKAPYLNVSFFVIRAFVIIGIWSLFYFFLTRNSLKQDSSGDQKLTGKNIKLSTVFIVIFAITISITSFDWLMSVEPHWFSTIFGIYYFSGTVVAALAAVTLAVVLLKEKGYLPEKITSDHLYSLGALMFVFVNFWAYIAFSQYLLIWYADLPEETFWFLQKWEGSWAIFSILLIVIQFLVPFVALLSKPAKMNPKRLKFIAIWLLFAHLFDLYWLVMPQMPGLEGGYVFSWIDFVFPIATVGFVILIFAMKAKKENLIPVGDPKLERGLDFHL